MFRAAVMEKYPTEAIHASTSGPGPAPPTSGPRRPEQKKPRKMTLPLIIFVVVFLGVVAGIAYISQFVTKDPITAPLKQAPKDVLFFPEKRDQQEVVAVWDPQDVSYAKDIEEGGGGHYHFLFQNKQGEAVKVGLVQKNCNCAEVHACLLTNEEATALGAPLSPAGMRGQLDLINASSGSGDGVSDYLGRKVEWIPLKNEQGKADPTLTVPAGQHGLVRLTWRGNKGKSDLQEIKVTLLTVLGESRQHKTVALLAKIRYVPVVTTVPRADEMTDWKNGQATKVFMAFSSTRTHFPLVTEVRDENNRKDPCFQAQLQPMDSAECFEKQMFLRRLAEQQQLPYPMRVLSAYWVKVTARQRIVTDKGEEKQLEQGQFVRKVELKSDRGDVYCAYKIVGIVHGVVQLGIGGKGTISLGSFPVNRGVVSPPFVLRVDPGWKLLPEETQVTPHFMKAELKKEKQWVLTLTVPPNSPITWPENSKVVLKAVQEGRENKARRISFPVRAVPFQKN
jgi:hypothetical protein